MNASIGSPPRPHWSPVELAEAVPRRPGELHHFEVHSDVPLAESAKGESHPAPEQPLHYVPDSIFPGMFRAH